jgi:nitroimidazol reductase NimA-like FMN-containing flavoprotein (pyridoxamine 5'-phosphate oxidase superfamily)
MELTAGFENIFKFIRIDYIRRLTYNDYELPYKVPVQQVNEDGETVTVMVPARRKLGAWGRNGVKITVRFAL